jgi:hypothetical protein
MLTPLAVEGKDPCLQLHAHSAMGQNIKEKGRNILQTFSDSSSPIFYIYKMTFTTLSITAVTVFTPTKEFR